MATTTELREKALKLAHEARAKLNEITPANEAELSAQVDAMLIESDKLDARAKQIEQIEAREAALNVADPRRPVEDRAAAKVDGKSADELRSEAFNAYLRGHELSREQRGYLRPDSEARTAQSVGTAANGGYLVPTDLSNQLTVALKAYGPLNDDSVVNYLRTSTGALLNIPYMNDTSNAGALIAENTQVSGSNLTFSQKPLGAYKFTTGVVQVSNELLQDSAVDIQKTVSDAMAERMGRVLNTYFTVGTGSSQPHGVVPTATAGITTASATAIAADELLGLIHSVDPAYRNNGSFMFNDATFLAVRKLKDSYGQYIWQPGLTVGQAASLFGYSYHVNQDMASIGASAIPALFGDFKKFTVREVNGFALARLTERYADYDQVGFIGFARYDSNMIDPRAVVALTNAAS